MTRKERFQWLVDNLEKITNKPCRLITGDLGGCWAVYVSDTNHHLCMELLIGFNTLKGLEREYNVFYRAYRMAKQEYQSK